MKTLLTALTGGLVQTWHCVDQCANWMMFPNLLQLLSHLHQILVWSVLFVFCLFTCVNFICPLWYVVAFHFCINWYFPYA